MNEHLNEIVYVLLLVTGAFRRGEIKREYLLLNFLDPSLFTDNVMIDLKHSQLINGDHFQDAYTVHTTSACQNSPEVDLSKLSKQCS